MTGASNFGAPTTQIKRLVPLRTNVKIFFILTVSPMARIKKVTKGYCEFIGRVHGSGVN